MRLGFVIALLAACGRIGFDPKGSPGGGEDDTTVTGDSGPVGDSGPSGDGAMPMIACADVNLGSALGANVASGSTAGAGNDYAGCSGDGNEVTVGWFAPVSASYRIDLCGSEPSWDSVLYIRSATCNGAQLACNDDACGGGGQLQPRVTVSLAAGQGIVIVVDSLFPADGTYRLAITQL